MPLYCSSSSNGGERMEATMNPQDRGRDMMPITRGRASARSTNRIRVLVADDHSLLRRALVELLSQQELVEVVGEAAHGREAVEESEELRPDVVLMDMVMPGLNGIEATRQIVKRLPSTRVVILTAYLEDERLLEALRAGAAGYVVKNSNLDELLLAIQSVHRGNRYFSTAISDTVPISELLIRAKTEETTSGYDLLTAREREVLQLIAEGKTNKEIATLLKLSVYTVEAHRGRIMEKLNVHSTGEIVRFAVRNGLVD
jgi:DNA-binding NarL/FixJ family response regulator